MENIFKNEKYSKSIHYGDKIFSLIQTITIVLIMLKLFNLINWNWTMVLSPIWITALIIIIIGIILILVLMFNKDEILNDLNIDDDYES